MSSLACRHCDYGGALRYQELSTTKFIVLTLFSTLRESNMSSIGNGTILSGIIVTHQTSITKKRLEIKELKEKIALLYREQNSHLPIFTLPEELLVFVFRLYITLSELDPVEVKTIWDNDDGGIDADADDPDVDEGNGSDSADDYDEPATSTRHRRRHHGDQRRWWLVPSQVCYHWRSVSLGNAVLWTIINTEMCSRLRILSLALSRSGEASLKVTMGHEGFGSSKQKITKLLKRARRIRSLELQISLGTLEEAIDEDCIPGQFDILESLEIQVTPPFDEDWTSFLGKGSALPAILQKVTPVFTRLTLTDIRLDLETLLSFPLSLTDLSISYESRHPSYLFKTLVAGLERLTLLERLYLRQSLSHGTVPPEIHLPNLKELSLIDDQPTAIDFFQSMSLPTTARIKLTIILSLTRNDDDEVITNTLSILARSIRRYMDSGEKKLTNAVLRYGDQCVEFKMGCDECDRHSYIFEFTIYTHSNSMLWCFYMFPSLQEAKAFSQIKRFSAEGLDRWRLTPPDWLQSLTEFVEIITVDDEPFVLHTS
ncbi:hypothetical protein QCA50_015413 [Cerrena zonata]|uniref:F-box domain-containing protein n=1 Tax=Cerrena zonata TaxID=2478898 RepID=A0AAW0FRJ4_9APHY